MLTACVLAVHGWGQPPSLCAPSLTRSVQVDKGNEYQGGMRQFYTGMRLVSYVNYRAWDPIIHTWSYLFYGSVIACNIEVCQYLLAGVWCTEGLVSLDVTLSYMPYLPFLSVFLRSR